MPLIFPSCTVPSLIVSNVEVSNAPIPPGRTGVWVTLIGGGAGGTQGQHVGNSNQDAAGGSGGGGGSRIGRVFIPISALGSTYSLTSGTRVFPTNQPAVFSSGSLVLTAGWASTSIGGVASTSGVPGGITVPMANGSNAGFGNTNGAGSGGGRGGDSRSGSSGGYAHAGTATGTSGGGDPLGLGGNGHNGLTGSFSNNAADGGQGGGGGGGGPAGAGNAPSGLGGPSYTLLEWV